MVGEVVITPRQKLADLIRLAELCVDLLRQNEEFYAEVIIFCQKILKILKLMLFSECLLKITRHKRRNPYFLKLCSPLNGVQFKKL